MWFMKLFRKACSLILELRFQIYILALVYNECLIWVSDCIAHKKRIGDERRNKADYNEIPIYL
ncbi:MAG: hypothetical protein JWR12_130 [Mucilaginibacter sp.]|nr:hypothetical protein [Mucilaginibacter sp.]